MVCHLLPFAKVGQYTPLICQNNVKIMITSDK